VLVARGMDGKLRLRITDFGISDIIARQVLDEATRATLASQSTPSLVRHAHTPLYASPQQKDGKDPDPADDVHALGVIWYQLVLGNPNQALGTDHRDDLIDLGLCDELIALLARCVASRAVRRPKNAAELADLIAKLPADLMKVAVASGQVHTPSEPTSSRTQDRQLDSLMPDTGAKSTQAEPQGGSTFTNSPGVKFVLVPRGRFWMGGGRGKPGEQQVEIPQDFYLGVYPVTQQHWQAVMGKNPSWFSRTGAGKYMVKNIADADLAQFPVEQVSWDDVQQFIDKLKAREKEREWVYRLPTEAEWEYACRGGATSQEDCAFDFYFDRPTNDLFPAQANFNANHQRSTKVGSYKPNRLGIYDMHGNVWEWCQELCEGSSRVFRGGSWYDGGSRCRAAYRLWSSPSFRNDYLGFRLARVPSAR
jgi:formylglycine-generating enzyme required for sulfatase activity